ILLYAHLVSLNHKKMKTFTKGYLPFMAILGITCGLVFIEPHLSGTMLLLGIGLILMYVGGTRLVYLLGTIGIGGAAAGYMIFGMGYEKDRIDVWLKPLEMFTKDKDMAWQTVQSLYAIGSGGLMGQGLGNSRQKHLFLPEPQNDFIFSIVCEELGFIGAVLIIILFGLLVWRGFVIGMKAPDKFGSMLAIGLTGQIGLQVAFNVAVVTNTIPNTGISLPFFSYGGTSLVMLLAQMGVVLSVSRSIQAEKA
ncbi:MAG: FtsW/RodA/SpoVE family cell cycle protein, partial [Oscillospiraceae bacterium]|nr:FtsW/RodA/SpoVE family cell cycle protein [Oscillospiraceae bacterium]